jgi:hypothetical protein
LLVRLTEEFQDLRRHALAHCPVLRVAAGEPGGIVRERFGEATGFFFGAPLREGGSVPKQFCQGRRTIGFFLLGPGIAALPFRRAQGLAPPLSSSLR